MPIYPYRCDKCGEEFEVFSKTFELKKEPVCPKCGGRKLTQVISASKIRTDVDKAKEKSLWR